MNQKLTLGSKFKYGLADLGFALITSAIQFFLLFYYTDVAGINPALAGLALMVGKLTWDAINDPLFGYWSDRTRSRFGRRRILHADRRCTTRYRCLDHVLVTKGFDRCVCLPGCAVQLLACGHIPHHDHHPVLCPDARADPRLQRTRQPDLDPHDFQCGRLHPGGSADYLAGWDLPGCRVEYAASLERSPERSSGQLPSPLP